MSPIDVPIRLTSRVLDTLRSPIAVPFSPWSALLVAGLAASWLNPNHYLPWPSFDGELSMAIVLALAVGAVASRLRTRWPIPIVAWFFVALAAVSACQLAAGLTHFSGDAWLYVLYFTGAALATMLGAKMHEIDRQAAADTVLGAAVMASLASVGVQLYQWLNLSILSDISGLGVWIVMTGTSWRPPGNLAQPNLLATLLVWGLLGLWWLFIRRRIGAVVACSAAAFVGFGIALTQSRAGWLSLVVVVLLAAVFRGPLGLRRTWLGVALLVSWFVLCVMALQHVSEALLLSGVGPALQERLTGDVRSMTWRVLLEAVSLRPMFGYGVGQVSVAQDAALLMHPASGERFSYSHNLVLDLLVWFGIPIGLSIALAATWWIACVARKVDSDRQVLMFTALCVLAVHSLVEYPHTYTFFLLPAAILVGALHADVMSARAAQTASRTLVAAVTAVCLMAIYWVFFEYRTAVSYMDARRFEQARIGAQVAGTPPRLVLLTQLGAFIEFSIVNVRATVTPEDLRLMQKVSQRFSGDALYFRYAMAAARAGEIDAAQGAMDRLCVFQAKDRCASVRDSWLREARDYPELAAVHVRVPR